MQGLARSVAIALGVVLASGCASAPARHHAGERPMRPTIDVLARDVTYDAAASTPGGDVQVTLRLVGERLLDYRDQRLAGVTTAGAVPAVAFFAPPNGHACCWQPSALALPGLTATPEASVGVAAQLDEEAPADLDVDRGAPRLEAAGVSLPTLEHAALPEGDIRRLRLLGVTSGSPAVATVDVGDPAAPFVVALRPAGARELASDPSVPPTTAPLPEAPGPSRGGKRCATASAELPERYARTLAALGSAFYHRRLATPHRVPRGAVTMTWAVLGPDHVRALFETSSRGCRQSVVLDVGLATGFAAARRRSRLPSRDGALYETNGRRETLVYDTLAYDVRGSTPLATRLVAAGLEVDRAALAAVTP